MEQGHQGGDPEPGGEDRDAWPDADVRRHPPVRALDEHPGAGLERRDALAVVPPRPDREAQARGGRGTGQRERVAARPAGAAEEAPHEELPGGDPHVVQVLPGEVQRDDAVALVHDGGHAQRVSQRQQRGAPDAEEEDADQREGVERPPVQSRPAMPDEVRAGPQLVRQRERDAEVRVQVQQVPRLVAELASGDADRGGDDEPDHERAGGRDEHPGERQDHRPCLPEHRLTRGARVADHDGHEVGEQEVERAEAHQAVPLGEPVLAERALGPRDSGHAQHLQEHEVAREQPAEPAERAHRGRAERQERLDPAPGDPERNHNERGHPGERPDRIRPPAPTRGRREHPRPPRSGVDVGPCRPEGGRARSRRDRHGPASGCRCAHEGSSDVQGGDRRRPNALG